MGAFENLLEPALLMADWLCVGVYIFTGTLWMFGNKTKAMEYAIGAATGYLIIRRAKSIQMFLKSL